MKEQPLIEAGAQKILEALAMLPDGVALAARTDRQPLSPAKLHAVLRRDLGE